MKPNTASLSFFDRQYRCFELSLRTRHIFYSNHLEAFSTPHKFVIAQLTRTYLKIYIITLSGLLLSFPRRREPSVLRPFWMPVSTGMTDLSCETHFEINSSNPCSCMKPLHTKQEIGLKGLYGGISSRDETCFSVCYAHHDQWTPCRH